MIGTGQATTFGFFASQRSLGQAPCKPNRLARALMRKPEPPSTVNCPADHRRWRSIKPVRSPGPCALVLDAAEGHVGVEPLVVGTMTDRGQRVDDRFLQVEKRLQVGSGHSGPDHARPDRGRKRTQALHFDFKGFDRRRARGHHLGRSHSDRCWGRPREKPASGETAGPTSIGIPAPQAPARLVSATSFRSSGSGMAIAIKTLVHSGMVAIGAMHFRAPPRITVIGRGGAPARTNPLMLSIRLFSGVVD